MGGVELVVDFDWDFVAGVLEEEGGTVGGVGGGGGWGVKRRKLKVKS